MLGETEMILIQESSWGTVDWETLALWHWATRRQPCCPQELTVQLQERKAGLGMGRRSRNLLILLKTFTVLWPVELYACGLCWNWTKPGPTSVVCAWFMIVFLEGQVPSTLFSLSSSLTSPNTDTSRAHQCLIYSIVLKVILRWWMSCLTWFNRCSIPLLFLFFCSARKIFSSF